MIRHKVAGRTKHLSTRSKEVQQVAYGETMSPASSMRPRDQVPDTALSGGSLRPRVPESDIEGDRQKSRALIHSLF